MSRRDPAPIINPHLDAISLKAAASIVRIGWDTAENLVRRYNPPHTKRGGAIWITPEILENIYLKSQGVVL